MKKPTTQQLTEKLRKKCVDLAMKKAKELVGYRCEHCGRTKKQGWQMHGSHIYPEGVYKSMSADVDNILCLCARCHTGGFWKGSTKPSWHEDPIYFAEWFNRKYPERAEILKKRSQESQSCHMAFWEEKLRRLSNK